MEAEGERKKEINVYNLNTNNKKICRNNDNYFVVI